MSNPIYIETDRKWYETRRVVGRFPDGRGNMVGGCQVLDWGTSPLNQYSTDREWVSIEREKGSYPLFKCSSYGVLRTGLVRAMLERFEASSEGFDLPPSPAPSTPAEEPHIMNLETIVSFSGATSTHCKACPHLGGKTFCTLHFMPGGGFAPIVDGRRCQACLMGTWRAERTAGARVWLDATGAGWYEISSCLEELVWAESLAPQGERRQYVLCPGIEGRFWCKPPRDGAEVPFDIFQAMVARHQELFPGEGAPR